VSRGPDAGTLLVRAVEADAFGAGCLIRIADSNWTRWASATFNGARHALCVEADDSPALERWLTALPGAGLAMRGHLLAELVVRGISRADRVATIALEALTVEE
jgi:hypothetical protein